MWSADALGFPLLMLLCLSLSTQYALSAVPYLTAGESKFNRSYFDSFNLSIINNTINMDMVILKPLTKAFRGHIECQVNLGILQKYQRVFHYDLGICDTINTVKENMFKHWFESMLQHGNFMPNCPVMPGHYYLRDWQMDAPMIPSYLHAGNYRVTAHFFYGQTGKKLETFVLDLTIYAQLKG